MYLTWSVIPIPPIIFYLQKIGTGAEIKIYDITGRMMLNYIVNEDLSSIDIRIAARHVCGDDGGRKSYLFTKDHDSKINGTAINQDRYFWKKIRQKIKRPPLK